MLKFVPNILTFVRLVLTAAFLLMVFYSPQAQNKVLLLNAAFVVFVTAGLTDIVDGKIARAFHVTSRFGRMMDPIADKILVCGSFICFAVIGEPALFGLSEPVLKILLWSVAAILIAREIYVTALRHMAEARGINFAATVSGKIKMFLQSFAIGTVIIKTAHFDNAQWANWFTTVVFAIMITVTVYSGLRSGRRSYRKQPVKEKT